MIAARIIDVAPVPPPTRTPHNSTRCHSDRMSVVAATAPVITASAASRTRRTPNRFITAAANGPISPNSAMLIATANEIAVRFHPNSVSSGTIRTPGVARTPAPTSRITKVTAATTQL